jgi:UDP-3-O-acyl N-acetylglucosamine deacetylase
MMRKIGQRRQRTLRYAVSIGGVGYLTGARVTVRFHPAPPNFGVAFLRTDCRDSEPLAALVANVTGANRRTTLGQTPAQVELVEHVLAALAGLRIDNCLIELNACELPGLDGSAAEFVAALASVPLELQSAVRSIWSPSQPVQVTDGRATLTLYPASAPGLTISYLLDYGRPSCLDRQIHSQRLTPTDCLNGLFESRTFLLETETVALRQQGIGAAASPMDLLVFGPRGPIGNSLRFANEPARHKVLDIVGDLALLGQDLAGHVVGYRSGHALNTRLVRELAAAISDYEPAARRAAA